MFMHATAQTACIYILIQFKVIVNFFDKFLLFLKKFKLYCKIIATEVNDINNYNNQNNNHNHRKIRMTPEEERLHNIRQQEKYNEIIRNQQLNKRRYIEDEPQDIRMYGNANFEPEPQLNKGNRSISKRFSKLIISILLIFTIIFSALFIGIYSLCSQTQFKEDKFSENENFFDIITTLNNNYNILLIGTDVDEEGTSRSDSMMLITVDRNNQKLKLTSFMRDLWVEIPNNGKKKLNAAYAIGGPELLIDTLKHNFNVNIDNYVLVDFDMFMELIDAIGGVTVEITEKEAEFMNRTTQAKVSSGINTLNGKDALIYCRIRKLDSDFMRTQRQRKVISAIFEKIKTQDITDNFKAITSVLPLIQTNISPFKMSMMSFSMIPVITYDFEQLRIPVDGEYTSTYINGQSVLLPDYNANSEAFNNFINN